MRTSPLVRGGFVRDVLREEWGGMNLINPLIVSLLQLLPKGLVKPFAMRYVAGEGLDDAVAS